MNLGSCLACTTRKIEDMKIEKIMTIDRFLEICERFSPLARKTIDKNWGKNLRDNIAKSIQQSEFEPVCNPWGLSTSVISTYGIAQYEEFVFSIYMWFYKGYVYAPSEVRKRDIDELRNEVLSKEQISLVILELYDNERRKFERLKNLYSVSSDEHEGYKRPRIPEKIRVDVWRRDEGKCVKCGNREKLEYDHIIPISKGGSNTTRNIELLCEKCNRSKGANIA